MPRAEGHPLMVATPQEVPSVKSVKSVVITSQIPELIAHRGASHDAPENTLAAIQLAWRQNADAVEVDVQLSKDRHLVVIHDATTSKTAGVRKKVAAQMLAELQSLDVGRWKHRKW